MNNRRKLRGFTLTELAIVLGIIGSILGGIWTASTMVRANNRNNQAQRQILTIIQNVRTLYSTRPTITSGDLTSAFINAGVFPSEMVNNGVTVNPWNTTQPGVANGVSVSSQSGWACSGANSMQFGVVYWGVPKSACIAILMAMTGPSAAVNGVNCAYSDGTGSVATDGSAEPTIETSCSGNVALGFNLK